MQFNNRFFLRFPAFVALNGLQQWYLCQWCDGSSFPAIIFHGAVVRYYVNIDAQLCTQNTSSAVDRLFLPRLVTSRRTHLWRRTHVSRFCWSTAFFDNNTNASCFWAVAFFSSKTRIFATQFLVQFLNVFSHVLVKASLNPFHGRCAIFRSGKMFLCGAMF